MMEIYSPTLDIYKVSSRVSGLTQSAKKLLAHVIFVRPFFPSKLGACAAVQINNVPRTRKDELGKPFDCIL